MVEVVQPGGGGGESSLIVTDGVTTVIDVTEIDFTGATVSDGGGGIADVDISGGGMAIGGNITSGTDGSVLFVGSGSVLAQNNANFFWDETNNRLGIDTDAPAKTLDVNGVFTLQDSGVRTLPAGLTTEANTQLLEFGINDGERDRFGVYDPSYAGGFFRFDSRSSSGILQIFLRPLGVSSVDGDLVMSLSNDGTNTNYSFNSPVFGGFAEIFLGDSFVTKWRIGKDNSNNLRIYSDALGGTAIQVIGSTGNVGIGVTSPTAKLHLAAGTTAASSAPLKFTPGDLLTTPEVGAMEFTDDGTDGHLYITVNVAGTPTRVQIV